MRYWWVNQNLEPATLKNVGSFSVAQQDYLAFHRKNDFLQTKFVF